MDESVQTEEKSGMSTKLISLIVGVVVLGAGGYFLLQGNKPAEQPKQEAITPEQAPVATESAVVSETKTFAVEGTPFSFNLKEIKVSKGDTVKIAFTNKKGMHDFVIDEFNAKTKQLKADETEEISFVASKSGTFEYYCSVGNHRQQGMVGKLIVE